MLGGHSGLEPPLPISNRAVKRTSANDSMLLACESRSLPSYLYQKPHYESSGVFLRLYVASATALDMALAYASSFSYGAFHQA